MTEPQSDDPSGKTPSDPGYRPDGEDGRTPDAADQAEGGDDETAQDG